jgi:tetratricopeptide (TPR) repeat protein
MLALLAGCAPLVPQTVALRTGWPAGVSEQVELRDVPFFPQRDYQCGPAALATVLAASGVGVGPDALVDQVWLPARRGSLQLEMLSTPRRYERISYRLAPHYADLLREVAAGNPVVVLQDVGMLGTQWHYAVVNGFDYATGTIYLRSGTEARIELPFTAFERSWMKSHYWAMVVTPPQRIAATAEENRWLESLSSFARAAGPGPAAQAYRTALQRWPDSLPAAIGLANHLHEQGKLAEAATVLRAAQQRHPQSEIVLNNLAQTLSDQGHHAEALSLIDKAADPQSPFAAEVRATRQLILQRLQRGKSAAR